MNRLMLCAGSTKREGWKTLDTSEKGNPDYWFHIPPLPIVVTEQRWDEIELIHGITSFYPWEAEQLLREIQSVLAPGGKLVLEQPHLLAILSAEISTDRKVEWLFGDPQFSNPAHMNKWAYTPEALVRLSMECGYSVIDCSAAQHHNPKRDFRMEAWK